jgi:hypothetical protein
MEAIVPMLALNLVTGEITKCELSEASLAEAIDNGAVGVKRVTRDKRDMYEGNYRGRGEWRNQERSEASLAEAIDKEAIGLKRVTRDKRDMYEGNYRERGKWRNWELSVDDKSRFGRRISPRELTEMPRFSPHTSWGGRRDGLGIPCSKLSSCEYSKGE